MFNQSCNIFMGCLLIVGLVAEANAAVSAKLIKIGNIEASSRIYNGTIIPIDEAPSMVQLRQYEFTMCGGTIISPQHVLTAAHCVENPGDLRETTVVGGASLRSDRGVERKILQIHIHPKRNKNTKVFDVAILKLNKPFEVGTKIQVQKNFCSVAPNVGEFVKVAGWGANKSVRDASQLSGADYSNELRAVRMPIISKDECKDKLIFLAKRLTDKMICAYSDYNANCAGDSGGPVMHHDQLCGIVSWGNGCAYGYPNVYTSIPSVLDFINEKLMM